MKVKTSFSVSSKTILEWFTNSGFAAENLQPCSTYVLCKNTLCGGCHCVQHYTSCHSTALEMWQLSNTLCLQRDAQEPDAPHPAFFITL